MKLDFTLDKAELAKIMKGFESQVDYTISQTINSTLVNIQDDVRKEMQENFTIRKPTYLKQSTKITKFAKKKDLEGTFEIVPVGNLAGSVFTKFEDGGDKVAKSGHSIAIPTDAIQPDKTRVVSQSKKPRNLKNSAKIKTADGDNLIIQSKGRGKNATTVVAYVLKPSVRIRPLLKFYDTAQASIISHLEANFAKAFQKSKDTMK